MLKRRPKVILIGGGRLAGLIYNMFHEDFDFIGYVDDVFPYAYVEENYGLPKLGSSDQLPEIKKVCDRAVVSITNVGARKKYRDLLVQSGFTLLTLQAKTAKIADNAQLGDGCIVRHQAVIGPMVVVGQNTVVSDHAYVGHDSVIGNNVYISPSANLNGSVTVGDDTFVGTGAVILPELKVGNRCVIGAAACVTKDVPDDSKWAGVPARPLSRKPGKPVVSVVIAAYNHGKYVSECIQSVLEQTYQDFEIVIVDDGSTDDTVDRIREFNDLRIKTHFFEQNQGAIVAKSKAFRMAEGKYIAILNSDDAFLPGKLGRQVACLEEFPDVGAVLTLVHVIDEEGQPFTDQNHFYYNVFEQPNRTRFEWLRRFFYQSNCLCIPSAIIRREVYDTIGWPDKRLLQLPDLDFWIRLSLHYELYIVQEKLTKFRVRANDANASAPRPDSSARDLWEFDKLLRHYLTIPNEDDLLQIFPEASRFVNPYYPLDQELIPYIIAQLSLETQHQRWRAFALDVLFEMLGDSRMARRLFETFRFSYRDFIQLTGIPAYTLAGG